MYVLATYYYSHITGLPFTLLIQPQRLLLSRPPPRQKETKPRTTTKKTGKRNQKTLGRSWTTFSLFFERRRIFNTASKSARGRKWRTRNCSSGLQENGEWRSNIESFRSQPCSRLSAVVHDQTKNLIRKHILASNTPLTQLSWRQTKKQGQGNYLLSRLSNSSKKKPHSKLEKANFLSWFISIGFISFLLSSERTYRMRPKT